MSTSSNDALMYAPAPAILVADTDIPTTQLVARELRQAFPAVETRIAAELFGAELGGRPLVISRLCYPQFSWLPGYLERRRIRYAYFLDDNFWELTSETSPVLAQFFRHPETVATLDAFVRGASVVIVWSQRLGEYVRSRFPNARVEFVAPGFDVAKVLALLEPRASQSTRSPNVVRVGYPSTPKTSVTALVVHIAENFLRKFGTEVVFDFIGWMPERLIGAPNVVHHPWIKDYDAYLEFKISRRWDIGMAPLMGTTFDRYKTSNKYREYGGCQVPAVYSRVSPFMESVRHHKTGLLVENEPEAWIAALEELVASPSVRSTIAQAAFDEIRLNYDLRITGRRFADVILHHICA